MLKKGLSLFRRQDTNEGIITGWDWMAHTGVCFSAWCFGSASVSYTTGSILAQFSAIHSIFLYL